LNQDTLILFYVCGADGQESTLTNAMSQCDAFGLQSTQAAAQVVQVIGVVITWRAHFESIGVSKSDLDSLAERLGGHLRAPRRSLKKTNQASIILRS
jgi:serine/threonine-protein kinase HipA